MCKVLLCLNSKRQLFMFICVHVWFAWMSVQQVQVVSVKVVNHMWVLGMEHGPSGRAVCALTLNWATSPAPDLNFYEHFVYMCACVCQCDVTTCMWRSEDSLQESVHRSSSLAEGISTVEACPQPDAWLFMWVNLSIDPYVCVTRGLTHWAIFPASRLYCCVVVVLF